MDPYLLSTFLLLCVTGNYSFTLSDKMFILKQITHREREKIPDEFSFVTIEKVLVVGEHVSSAQCIHTVMNTLC